MESIFFRVDGCEPPASEVMIESNCQAIPFTVLQHPVHGWGQPSYLHLREEVLPYTVCPVRIWWMLVQ